MDYLAGTDVNLSWQNGAIVHEVKKLYGGYPYKGTEMKRYTATEMHNISDTILRLYIDAVQNKGYPPYVAGETKSAPLRRYILNNVPYSNTVTDAILKGIQIAGTNGRIDPYYYDPRTHKEPVKTADPISKIEDAVKYGWNSLLMTGAAIAIGYITYKELTRPKR